MATGDGGATPVDPVEVDPHADAEERRDNEEGAEREARAPGGAAEPGAEAVRR